jgi:hexosaminidase
MRYPALSLVACAALVAIGCETEGGAPSLIPAPEHLELRAGAFSLDEGSEIVVSDATDGELVQLAELVGAEIRAATGLPASTGEGDSGQILLTMDADAAGPALTSDSPLARDEAYTLTVAPAGIEIRAATHAGLFYGTRTLLQLLPPTPDDVDGWTVPALEIRDHPRFVYRGLHLDVGRHFFPAEYIKRYIDVLARHKLNVFHWHLTEDQGWRLEIEAYPRLAEVSAWRAETIVEKNFDPYVGDGVPYGGYYTRDQVRDIVAYAEERYVTIVPEIEMPGHSVAVLAAYPELACTPGPFEVSTVWGVKDDIYCPHEQTFEFLENVLTEVMELFPSPYIHIGGDEAPKRRWEESPVAQEIIRREGLADEFELQSWFIQRIESFLLQNGRRLIGWDEILEGGLAPQATVMSWRGVNGGIEAARQGHDVVMTPTSHMYFDYYQGRNREGEPLAIGGYLPLELVYSYEPVPDELTAEEGRRVLGAQGNVWTEYIKTPEHVDYMAYPRALALAELTWSPREARDWTDFSGRLPAGLARLGALGVNYRIPEPTGLEEDRLTLGSFIELDLGSPLPWGEIRYTLDGTDPTAASRKYDTAFDLPVDSEAVTVSARLALPDGRTGPVARAEFARTVLRTGLDIDSTRLRPGLSLDYAEGEFASVSEVVDAEAARRGSSPRVEIPGVAREASFGLRFGGYLRVPYDDIYSFEITSDDGSQLIIDEQVVIDHDGYHSATAKAGAIGLSKGHHRLRILYFQGGGGRSLTLRVRRGQDPFEPVPDEWLYIEDHLASDPDLPMTDAP